MKKNLFSQNKNIIAPDNATNSNNSNTLISEKEWDCWFPKNLKYIDLFKSEILSNKRMKQTRIPYGPGGCYIGSIFFTIEVLIKCWETLPLYNLHCDKCGEKIVVYYWSGSPLSGSCSYSYKCLNCGKSGVLRNIPFRNFWKQTSVISMECMKEDDGNYASCYEFIHFVERLKLVAN